MPNTFVPDDVSDHIDEVANAASALMNALDIPREHLVSGADIRQVMNHLPAIKEQRAHELVNQIFVRLQLAVCYGLFDCAVSFAWNIVIELLQSQLNAFGSENARTLLPKSFADHDLDTLPANRLLLACRNLGLVSETSYRLLSECRIIRNHHSAAHSRGAIPTATETTQFIRNCAIALQSLDTSINITAFLNDMLDENAPFSNLPSWRTQLSDLDDGPFESVAVQLFKTCCNLEQPRTVRGIATALLILSKHRLTATVVSRIVAQYDAYWREAFTGDPSTDSTVMEQSRALLETLELTHYLPEHQRNMVIANAVGALRRAHDSWDNFYNEPEPAKHLADVVKRMRYKVPDLVRRMYVETIVVCFIGNGYGVSRHALPYYRQMIEHFSTDEIAIMLSLHEQSTNPIVDRIHSFKSCHDNFTKAVHLLQVSRVPAVLRPTYHILASSN